MNGYVSGKNSVSLNDECFLINGEQKQPSGADEFLFRQHHFMDMEKNC